MVLLIVLLYALGLTMLFRPNLWWMLLEAKKHPEGTVPAETFVKRTRIEGGAFLVAATALLLVALLR